MMSRKQQRMHRKPWISKGILKSIKTKNKLFSKIKNLDKTNSNKWNKYKNKMNHIIEYAKMTYFKSQIAQKGNNSRKLWSAINEILNKGKKQINVINKVQNELGSSDTTAFDIANTLSKYFSSIGEKLANQIEKPKTSPASNLQTSFVLSPTFPEEVQQEISNSDAKKAVPINDIPIKYLKLADTTISKFLSDLSNTCILDSEYPDALKIAQIIPIHKSGSKECCSNYRPISILPAINKVFEKLLCSRLYSYVETNELLSPSQYGFREGTSTELAINEIYNYYLHNRSGISNFFNISISIQRI